MTTNKTHEIGAYVEDIPMRLSERCRPIDLSAYIEEEVHIPPLPDHNYRFSAELYALEVFEFRDQQIQKQLSHLMSKLNAKSDDNSRVSEHSLRVKYQMSDNTNGVKKSIHLNGTEILKPLPKMSDNYSMSDVSIDPNIHIKKKFSIKDFESDTSSPFDYVELQTIDDMQELSDVFQEFQNKCIQNSPTVPTVPTVAPVVGSVDETNSKSDEINDNSINYNSNTMLSVNESNSEVKTSEWQTRQPPKQTSSEDHSEYDSKKLVTIQEVTGVERHIALRVLQTYNGNVALAIDSIISDP